MPKKKKVSLSRKSTKANPRRKTKLNPRRKKLTKRNPKRRYRRNPELPKNLLGFNSDEFLSDQEYENFVLDFVRNDYSFEQKFIACLYYYKFTDWEFDIKSKFIDSFYGKFMKHLLGDSDLNVMQTKRFEKDFDNNLDNNLNFEKLLIFSFVKTDNYEEILNSRENLIKAAIVLNDVDFNMDDVLEDMNVMIAEQKNTIYE